MPIELMIAQDILTIGPALLKGVPMPEKNSKKIPQLFETILK